MTKKCNANLNDGLKRARNRQNVGFEIVEVFNMKLFRPRPKVWVRTGWKLGFYVVRVKGEVLRGWAGNGNKDRPPLVNVHLSLIAFQITYL